MSDPGWQKLCEGKKGLQRKVWTFTKFLGTNIRYFVAILRFVAIYALFGRLGAKKCSFETTTAFLGHEVHYYRVYIAYYTFVVIFALAERSQTSAPLVRPMSCPSTAGYSGY